MRFGAGGWALKLTSFQVHVSSLLIQFIASTIVNDREPPHWILLYSTPSFHPLPPSLLQVPPHPQPLSIPIIHLWHSVPLLPTFHLTHLHRMTLAHSYGPRTLPEAVLGRTSWPHQAGLFAWGDIDLRHTQLTFYQLVTRSDGWRRWHRL